MNTVFRFTLLWIVTLPFGFAFGQSNQKIYLQITDAAGQVIRGSSVDRGYERQIEITNFSGYSTGSATVKFTMPSGTATATLANLQTTKQKSIWALFTLTESGETKSNAGSAIRLEDMNVTSVSDTNGSTEVALKASRIGATYFQKNIKTGVRTVSSKTGFDFINQQPWTSF